MADSINVPDKLV